MSGGARLLGFSVLGVAALIALTLLFIGDGGARRRRIQRLVAADDGAAVEREAPPPEAAAPHAGRALRAPLLPDRLAARLSRLGVSVEELGLALRPWPVALTAALSALLSLVFLHFLLQAAWWLAALAALAAAVAGAWLGVRMMRERRRARFLDHFPDAIDLVVRAVRAGLPVMEALFAVGRDVPDPVGKAFREIGDQIRIGVSLDEALWQVAERVDVADFRIFVVSLALQRETGGNLGETLANLGVVMRRRRELRLKAKALSSEARAAALVISALPFLAGAGLLVLNPAYLGRFATDPSGGYLLAAAGMEIALGMLIMHALIKRAVR